MTCRPKHPDVLKCTRSLRSTTTPPPGLPGSGCSDLQGRAPHLHDAAAGSKEHFRQALKNRLPRPRCSSAAPRARRGWPPAIEKQYYFDRPFVVAPERITGTTCRAFLHLRPSSGRTNRSTWTPHCYPTCSRVRPAARPQCGGCLAWFWAFTAHGCHWWPHGRYRGCGQQMTTCHQPGCRRRESAPSSGVAQGDTRQLRQKQAGRAGDTAQPPWIAHRADELRLCPVYSESAPMVVPQAA